MSADERISMWLAQLRVAGRGVLSARLLILLAGAVALVVPAVQPWDQPDLVPVVGVPLLVCVAVLPDSLAALAFIFVVVFGWLMRGPADPSWSIAVTAMALVVLHLASAFAGQLPSYARISRAALHRWWLPAATALLLAPAVALITALVRHAEVPGSLVVTTAALVLTTATIWLTADQHPNRD
ncbi:hypothetical protein [Kribbella sp. NPDC048915]|uniref:hypothetical protein n=1 Tax=Kribbella sp. NPDC048915 TaxID=3155148 RepID=UPI0033CFF915